MTDVLVVGSGPSGALAAATLLERGLSVHLVHFGYDDTKYRDLIPDAPFEAVRSEDAGQDRYFLGDDGEGVPTGKLRIGSQLTPPRQFVTRDADRLLPYASETFMPMQSLALGGLGAAWGAACYTYSDAELARIGIQDAQFPAHYAAVAQHVGVSAALADDTARDCTARLTHAQPPTHIDDNAMALLAAYRRRPGGSLRLGRMPLAMLTEPLGDRAANPYFDMDFWSDVRRSIYRPRYTIEALLANPRFRCSDRLLAVRYAEDADGVQLHCLQDGERVTLTAKRLLLCAGAINSARIVLAAQDSTARVPILCNPYTYIPCVQLRMLGKAVAPARHSMAQLAGILAPDDDPQDLVSLQLYSYRSLLNFKLVKEIPLPAWAGLQVTRLLATSLTIVGVHHSDAPDARNWLQLQPAQQAGPVPIALQYDPEPALIAKRQARERQVLRELRRLGCYGGLLLRPGHASSIHYAGTLPILEPGSADRPGTEASGRVVGSQRVFVGDSAGWRFLPAKGLTFTLMANARRIALNVAESLRTPGELP